MEFKTIHIVSIGLITICISAMFFGEHDIAIGALTALAGWMGGNYNGKKEVSAKT